MRWPQKASGAGVGIDRRAILTFLCEVTERSASVPYLDKAALSLCANA